MIPTDNTKQSEPQCLKSLVFKLHTGWNLRRGVVRYFFEVENGWWWPFGKFTELCEIINSDKTVWFSTLFLWWHFAQPPRGQRNTETCGEAPRTRADKPGLRKEKSKTLACKTGWFLWCKYSHYDWFQLLISSDSSSAGSYRVIGASPGRSRLWQKARLEETRAQILALDSSYEALDQLP